LRYALADEAVYKCLVIAADDPEPKVRERAVRTLAEHLQRDGVANASLLLSSDDEELAVRAARALGETGDERLVPFLSQSRDTAKPKVSKAAEAAITRIAEIKEERAERRKERQEKRDP
jgi:HEAT repeat protein